MGAPGEYLQGLACWHQAGTRGSRAVSRRGDKFESPSDTLANHPCKRVGGDIDDLEPRVVAMLQMERLIEVAEFGRLHLVEGRSHISHFVEQAVDLCLAETRRRLRRGIQFRPAASRSA